LWEKFEADTAESVFLDFRPTLFFGVPTIYVRLLKLENDVCRQIGLRMRLFVSGSAPLPLEVFKDFQKKFGHTILERYGMTETLMNTSNPYLGERIGGTVGQALPDVEIKLLNELGVEVGDNEVGEIHVRGPNVFPGYWRKPEATHNAFVDGYFRTGDLAKKSPDGYYSICGRKKDLIISSGFNIYPREIEEFLERQSGIAEAAVVGIIDTVRGEVPIAFVVPSESFDPAKIKEICRQNLASFKIPQRFITVSQLPRNALGKIQKQLLLETESPWGNSFSVD
jgi:malonyl-CoA/methylmalonyl-CoA synthetase